MNKQQTKLIMQALVVIIRAHTDGRFEYPIIDRLKEEIAAIDNE